MEGNTPACDALVTKLCAWRKQRQDVVIAQHGQFITALPDDMPFEIEPPYLLDIDGDPLVLIDANGQASRVANGYELDETLVDFERLPSGSEDVSEDNDMLVTFPIRVDNQVELARIVPAREDLSLASDEPELPASVTRIWDALDRLWAETSFADLSSLKEELSKVIYRHMIGRYRQAEYDDARFAAFLEADFAEEKLSRLIASVAPLADRSRSDDDTDVLDLEQFLEMDVETRRQRSLVWSCALDDDPDRALRTLLAADQAAIGNIDEYASYEGNSRLMPLMQAASSQSCEFVRRLIDFGAYLDVLCDNGFSALTYAAMSNRLDNALQLLERGASVDPVPRRQGSHSPLAAAVAMGHLEIVELLIEHGADIDWQDASGQAIVKSAARSGRLDCLSRLIEAGADPVAYDDEGFAAIHDAADNGHAAIIERLLDAGVDVDLPIMGSTDEEGRTALNHACGFAHPEVARLLLERGARADLKFRNSGSCLLTTLLHLRGDREEKRALLHLLLDHGGIANLESEHFSNALYFAFTTAPVGLLGQILESAVADREGDALDERRRHVNEILASWSGAKEDQGHQEHLREMFEGLGEDPNRRNIVLKTLKGLAIDWLEIPDE